MNAPRPSPDHVPTALATLTILIVDDHFVVRSGLVTSLELADDLKVVGEAESGEEAIPAYTRHCPAVVLLDLQLPGCGGVDVTRQLCTLDPRARVLIFSNYSRDDEIQAALDAGASGYIPKSASRDDLLNALRTVGAGRKFLPADVAQRLANARLGPAITPREREILAHIAAGCANKEIAAALAISEFTVKRHVSHILDKMSVNDRAQAVVEALRRGLLKLPE